MLSGRLSEANSLVSSARCHRRVERARFAITAYVEQAVNVALGHLDKFPIMSLMLRNYSGIMMSPHQAFTQQLLTFHTAIVDNCDRAVRPDRTDEMALRLRNNAAVLAKLQLAMLSLTASEPTQARLLDEPRQPEPLRVEADPETPSPGYDDIREPRSFPQSDHMLSGDVLSHFVSRRMQPGESPHQVWQALQHDRELSAKPKRTPALPRKGFRSPAT